MTEIRILKEIGMLKGYRTIHLNWYEADHKVSQNLFLGLKVLTMKWELHRQVWIHGLGNDFQMTWLAQRSTRYLHTILLNQTPVLENGIQAFLIPE